MPTLEEIKERIKDFGEVDTFGTKKEIRYLPEILAEDETLEGITSGLMGGNTWLIALTNKRIIFLDKGMIYGLKQKEIPLNKVNSIEQKTGIVFGEIGIWDGASQMQIKNVYKNTVKTFVLSVNKAISDAKKSPRFSAPQTDLASQVEKLASLRDEGILTEEEFSDQKRKLLGT